MHAEHESSTKDSSIFAEDKLAIHTLLRRMCDAWAHGDGEAYAACFSEDSDYITFNGIHLRGRSENASLHRALFRRALKGTRIDPEVTTIAMLSESMALAHTENRRRKSLQTFVLVKSQSGWLIRSFQNTRARPLSIRLTRWMAS